MPANDARSLPFSRLSIPGASGGEGQASSRPVTPKGQAREQPFFYKWSDKSVKLPPPFTGSPDGDTAFFVAKALELGETSEKVTEALADLQKALSDPATHPYARSFAKDDALLTACVRAHGYSVPKALAAIKTVAKWEAQPGCPLGRLPADLAIEVLSNGFCELLPVRDKDGCAVIMLREASKINQLTNKYTLDSVVKAIGWLVMEAVRDSAETQLCGITILEDMSGYSVLRNLGFMMNGELDRAKVSMGAIFPGFAPYKMGTVIIYNVPDAVGMTSGWSVSYMFAPKSTIVARTAAHSGVHEMKDKVASRFLPDSTLPHHIGGPLKYNFGEWLAAKHLQLCGSAWTPTNAYAKMPTSREDPSMAPYPPRQLAPSRR